MEIAEKDIIISNGQAGNAVLSKTLELQIEETARVIRQKENAVYELQILKETGARELEVSNDRHGTLVFERDTLFHKINAFTIDVQNLRRELDSSKERIIDLVCHSNESFDTLQMYHFFLLSFD